MDTEEINQAIYYTQELLKALEGYRDRTNFAQLQSAYGLSTEVRKITGEEIKRIKK